MSTTITYTKGTIGARYKIEARVYTQILNAFDFVWRHGLSEWCIKIIYKVAKNGMVTKK